MLCAAAELPPLSGADASRPGLLMFDLVGLNRK